MSNESENLKAAAQIMKAFQDQTNMMQGMSNPTIIPPTPAGTNEFDNQGGDFATPGSGNHIGMGFDNQGDPGQTNLIQPTTPINTQPPVQPPIQPAQTINSVPATPVSSPIPTQTINSGPSTPASSPMPAQRADVCPECNSMHPPLKAGEKCPNVGIGSAGDKMGIDDTIINKHLVDMRNIIISNMTSKNIKDGNKFFQYAVVELTKALEVYHE